MNACTLCEAGNYISAGSCVSCPAGYKCDGISRTQCVVGTYALEGANECVDCVANCTECDSTTGECSACDEDYSLSANNTCEVANCGDLAMKITISGQDVCVTKYNVGDIDGLPLPTSDLTIAVAGSGSCAPSSANFCCWTGTTSTTCDSENGGYSGCTRTVCDWRAANKVCESLTYLNKTWQLPTSNEWALIGAQIDSVSIGQGSDGLMLCDEYATYSSARCYDQERCSGAGNAKCYIHHVWSSTADGSSTAYLYNLVKGDWGVLSRSVKYANSVRCLTYL